MNKPNCPHCQHNEKVVKAGFNPGGSQRYRCHHCRKYFTANPSPRGLEPALQKQALKLYLEGTSFRAIGRLLNVHHQSVINWINAQATNLPPQVSETQATDTIEIDELFTFIGTKKKKSI